MFRKNLFELLRGSIIFILITTSFVLTVAYVKVSTEYKMYKTFMEARKDEMSYPVPLEPIKGLK